MLRKYPTVLLAGAALAFVVTGCKKEGKGGDNKEAQKGTTTPEPKKEPEKPTKVGLEAGDPKVVKAFKAVLDSCEVSDWGYVRRKTCKDPEAPKGLEKQEKMVGLKASLMTYCHALTDKNHVARALASYRLSLMNYSRRMAEAADKEVFECLMPRFKAAKKGQDVRRLARSVTYMGTALKREAEVLKALEEHSDPQAKRAGYGALWANGRMRVFDKLAEAVKGSDSKLAIAAIKSFGLGERPSDQEKAKVCELLKPFMVNENLNLASSSAYRVAAICKDAKDKDDVIKAADDMIGKKKFDLTYVSALRTTAGFFTNKASKAQSAKIVGVLSKVIASDVASALTRSSALGAIFRIDKAAGKKLAKKYKADKSGIVAKEAERILKGS